MGFVLSLPLETFRDTLLNFKEADYYTYQSLCRLINAKYPGMVFYPQAAGNQEALAVLRDFKNNLADESSGGFGETRRLMEAYSADLG